MDTLRLSSGKSLGLWGTSAVAFLLCTTLTSTLAGQSGRTAKIHGQILLNSAEEQPEMVRVTLYTAVGSHFAAKTLTVDTSFVFDGVPMGTYDLVVESPGFERSSKTIVVSAPVSRYEMMVSIPLGAPLEPRREAADRPPPGKPTVDPKTLAMPDAALKQMKRAEQAAAKGEYNKAISYLEKAAEIFPEGYQIYNNLAVHYLATRQFDKAESALQKASLLNSDDSTSRRNLAQIHLMKGEYESALEQLDTALALDPKNSKSLMLLGETYLGLGDCETALDYFQAAVELNPEDHSYLGMGQCYAQVGELEKAIAELRAFLDKHPDDPRAAQIEALIQQLGS